VREERLQSGAVAEPKPKDVERLQSLALDLDELSRRKKEAISRFNMSIPPCVFPRKTRPKRAYNLSAKTHPTLATLLKRISTTSKVSIKTRGKKSPPYIIAHVGNY